MTETAFHNPGLQVGLVLRRVQLRWPGVARLRDGLTGPLRLSGISIAQDRGGRDPLWLSALTACERLAFPLRAGTGPARNATRSEPARCDVIVDFRSQVPPEELVRQARHGVWQLSCHAHGVVAGDVLGGATATECVLVVHTAEEPAGRPVAKARVQTKTLVSLSRDFASEKAVQLLLHHLRRLALTGTLAPAIDMPPIAGAPNPAHLPHYALSVIREAIERRRDRKAGAKPFSLRFGPGALPEIDPATGIDVAPAPGTYAADPFLVERGGDVYCFYEEYPYDSRIGRIAVAKLDDAGAERIGIALEMPYHLSFPFLFEDDGMLCMMPETLAADRIEIWRCTEFPLGWTRLATGPEGLRLADPVLFKRDDEWLLFGNTCHDERGDFSSELSLFQISGPDLAEVVPHPLNPVVVGSDVARSGGRVFERDGRLYRMSQDNSGRHYGYGLNVMEITELSATTYAERRVAQFTPDRVPRSIGCHHADSAAGRWVVDLRWP